MSETIKITFSLNGENNEIEGYNQELMFNIYKRYVMMIGREIENFYFLYNGDLINPERKLKDICEKNKKITILVCEFEIDDIQEEILKQSKDIICPICNEICLINFINYKINFNFCKNGHRFSNILFNEFNDLQKINESKIICNKCNEKNKNNTTDNKFYKCCNCNINLCPLCKLRHDKTHLIIDYDNKNYFCNEHGKRYILHCEQNNKDLCDSCEYPQKNKFSFLYKLSNNIKNKMDNLRTKIDNLKEEISKCSNIINKVIDNLELYYNIANNIIKNFDKKYLNYYILMTINNINDFNDIIIKDISEILNEDNIEKKNNYISKIYEKMIIDVEFTLTYNINKVGILRIFGEPFVKKNKNNFKLIINKKNYELTHILNIIDIETKKQSNEIINVELDLWTFTGRLSKNIPKEVIKPEILNEVPKIEAKINEPFEIKLKQIKNITDISYMFGGCQMLRSVENSNWDTENITNMKAVFNECRSLIKLPDISKWKLSNVDSISNLFSECKSLQSLPDIYKWNTKNIQDMSFVFNRCMALKKLPDISKWNTSNLQI